MFTYQCLLMFHFFYLCIDWKSQEKHHHNMGTLVIDQKYINSSFPHSNKSYCFRILKNHVSILFLQSLWQHLGALHWPLWSASELVKCFRISQEGKGNPDFFLDHNSLLAAVLKAVGNTEFERASHFYSHYLCLQQIRCI